jgi:hypothetical protein
VQKKDILRFAAIGCSIAHDQIGWLGLPGGLSSIWKSSLRSLALPDFND